MGSDSEAMRIVAAITARWHSERFPGKMLADINGRPMLQIVVDQCCKSCVDDVVVATTWNSQPIIDYCEANSIHYCAGDENDIIHRLYIAAGAADADILVRAWGDAPLTNPNVINRLVKAWEDKKSNYIHAPQEALGTSAALVTTRQLDYDKHLLFGNEEASLWYHRYCIKQPYALAIPSKFDMSGINLSVDDEKSLELVRSILA